MKQSAKTRRNSLAVGMLQRHQEHSKLRSNDIVLIQHHNPIQNSGARFPSTRGIKNRKHLYLCQTLNKWSNMSWRNPNPLFGCQWARCYLDILVYSIIGLNNTTLDSSHYKSLHDNTDRQVLPWLLDFHLTANCWLFMTTNIGKFSPHNMF